MQEQARRTLTITAPELLAILEGSKPGGTTLKLVDASWHLPDQARDGRKEYLEKRLPGAVLFDIDTIADATSGLPHTLASVALFSTKVGRLGISEDDAIVVYDSLGLFSAPRVAWNFRFMGARNVRVLDGGLPAWIKAGGSLESGAPAPPVERLFDGRSSDGLTVDRHRLAQHLAEGTARVLDVRSAERFSGQAPEPRAGLRAGHMPGAINLPFTELLHEGALKRTQALVDRFAQAGVAEDDLVITSCGSGVTAAIAILALECIGHTRCALYDGSWSEWGACSDTEVITD